MAPTISPSRACLNAPTSAKFRSQLMWVLADVIGLFSRNVGSFSLNVGRSARIFSTNVVPERPM